MLVDLFGQKFGKLRVVSREKNGPRGAAHWLCVCECANIVTVSASNLSSGHTQSCGCLDQESRITRNLTHGKTHTSEYKAWSEAKQRCINPKNKRYDSYGARGITMCPEWLDSFETFYADMGDKPSPLHSLDRKENDKGYSPGNCHWATEKQQANNMTTNRKLEFCGQTKTVAQWAEELHLPRGTISSRLSRGWSVDRALSDGVQ